MIDFGYKAHFRGFKRIIIRNFNINFIHSTSSSVSCPTILWCVPSYGVMTGPLKRPAVSTSCDESHALTPKMSYSLAKGEEGVGYIDYRLQVEERRLRRDRSVHRPFHEGFDESVGPT